MKRAVPQDANSVPLRGTDAEAVEDHPRQTLPEDNRRVCTSAAMIGLAISAELRHRCRAKELNLHLAELLVSKNDLLKVSSI